MTKFTHFLILLALTSCLCSCAMVSAKKDSDTLEKNIKTLWSARVENQWGKVYDLTDTAFQEKTSKEQFSSSGEMQVIEYQIKSLTIDPQDPEKADVMIQFKINKMGYVFQPTVRELWLFEKNRGWVLNKTRMNSVKPL